ncbi:hypothetical protein BOTNAR_0230g00010 [Botryotinia narcissicola]|uniref:Uncharacterized protein n=1 Tax=Botryotinia narcissicola TaxID=278944 RepID=A0A4Z1IAY0_9HELO|nr:hypothetical protein BOTNAR_0230g00010 [Botryotinia narcissicola]
MFTEPYRISSLTNLQQENSSGGETNKTPPPTTQHSTAQHKTIESNPNPKQSKARQRPTADPIKKRLKKP